MNLYRSYTNLSSLFWADQVQSPVKPTLDVNLQHFLGRAFVPRTTAQRTCGHCISVSWACPRILATPNCHFWHECITDNTRCSRHHGRPPNCPIRQSLRCNSTIRNPYYSNQLGTLRLGGLVELIAFWRQSREMLRGLPDRKGRHFLQQCHGSSGQGRSTGSVTPITLEVLSQGVNSALLPSMGHPDFSAQMSNSDPYSQNSEACCHLSVRCQLRSS